MSRLAVSGVSVSLGGRAVLAGVDLAAAPGRMVGLIGPNGAGKSTLLRAILGLVPIDDGAVAFDDADLLAMPRRQRAQLGALVEQAAFSEAHLSVRDVALLGRIPFQSAWQALPSPADEAIAADALATVGLAGLAERPFHTLSGGEQQRLQVARMLSQQPRLMLLDEPTNHLDVEAQLMVLDLLRARARAGAVVVVALHDLNLAAAFCDELVALRAGRVLGRGTPDEVLTPALLRELYGVGAALLRHPSDGRLVIAYDLPGPTRS